MDIDDDVIQEILTSQDATELAPTDEMMMMNSATANDIDLLDPEIASILQQSSIQINPPAPSTAATTTTTTTTTIIKKSNVPVNNDDDDDEDEFIEDETFLERITALKEMFPESLQNAVGKINSTVISSTKGAFSKGRTAAWWVTSTMCVLVFPILIQKELLQVAEQISREQRSILLGPQAATGAFSGGAF